MFAHGNGPSLGSGECNGLNPAYHSGAVWLRTLFVPCINLKDSRKTWKRASQRSSITAPDLRNLLSAMIV